MRLPSIQTSDGMFTLLELDKTKALAEEIGVSWDDEGGQEILRAVLERLLSTLGSQVSGIVTEPEYSLDLFAKGESTAGLLCALEKNHALELDPLAVPTLTPNWGVEAVHNNYAVAKLELYYHPSEEQALAKKQLVAELYDYCQHEHIDFYLKLIIYTPADQDFQPSVFQADQLTAIQEFRNECDVIGLQYPQDTLASATITAELDVPWILVADGYNYDEFKEVLRDALGSGARGFEVGETVWKELFNLQTPDARPDLAAITDFIKTTARDRLIELSRITAEFAENTLASA